MTHTRTYDPADLLALFDLTGALGVGARSSLQRVQKEVPLDGEVREYRVIVEALVEVPNGE
jgi:hypothetical protein